jgi:hypothetical protein
VEEKEECHLEWVVEECHLEWVECHLEWVECLIWAE